MKSTWIIRLEIKFHKNLYSMVLMAGIDSDRSIGGREFHIRGSLLK